YWSAYNMRSGGTLLLLDSTPPAAAAKKPSKVEALTIRVIRAELAALALSRHVSGSCSTGAAPITVDGTWLEARRERKVAVPETKTDRSVTCYSHGKRNPKEVSPTRIVNIRVKK
ncbi:hypothetical protein BJY52DRAFT_1230579, partial [Lactarius psammicola]